MSFERTNDRATGCTSGQISTYRGDDPQGRIHRRSNRRRLRSFNDVNGDFASEGPFECVTSRRPITNQRRLGGVHHPMLTVAHCAKNHPVVAETCSERPVQRLEPRVRERVETSHEVVVSEKFVRSDVRCRCSGLCGGRGDSIFDEPIPQDASENKSQKSDKTPPPSRGRHRLARCLPCLRCPHTSQIGDIPASPEHPVVIPPISIAAGDVASSD